MSNIVAFVIIKSCGFTEGFIVQGQWLLAILHSELDLELFERTNLRVINMWVWVFNLSTPELPQVGTLSYFESEYHLRSNPEHFGYYRPTDGVPFRPREKIVYAGTLPLCNKCHYHHNGPCTAKCANCKRVGHLTRDCKSPAAANNQITLTCFECGNQGHYRSDCPELKNRNCGNQARSSEARGRVYALGGGETDQDPNNSEGEIEA
ncbi:reverse transcriptase domain-containing protein [Tanacetum coccineum]